VVAGGQHACALDTTQYAWCWGTDAVLELGHSTTQTGAPCQLGNWCAPQAQQVVGTTTSQKYYYKFSYLGAGDRRTCGIAAAGANVGYTFCWGGSFLGTSNAMLFDWDKPVSGMHTFTSFSLGPTHTCALTNTGAAWCWGRNTSGELGDGAVLSGSFPEEFDPVQVVGGHVFASITAGAGFTCAVDTAGAMWCWGQGANDQLAANQGTLALSSSPIAIASTMKFVSLAGGAMPGTGAFGCAIQRGTSTVAGPAYCWGNLIDKQLGINRSETCSGSACRTTPVPVARGLHFNALAVGTNHTCALDDAGNVSCFGANGSGELGRGNLAGAVCPFGSSACSADATAVSLGGHVMASIAAGGHHTCGIERATGAAYCWGDDSWGQLGANPQWGCGIGYCSPTPAAVATTERFQTLTGGYLFTCGLTVNNEVACWGDNSGGQLGNSATPTGATVQKVALPGTPSLVAAGADHACAQTMVYNLKVQANQYTTYCWGGNRFGQLGTGGTSTAKSPPTAANGAPGYFVALVAGVGFTCGIGTNGPPWIGVPTTGSLFCWGNGIGGGAAATLPTQIAPGVSFRSLSTRLDNVCGITSKGTTMCFGGGMHGELGTGAQTASATPVQVLGD
jgi:alpha-tubulin suppressor-like RCC1 family protein